MKLTARSGNQESQYNNSMEDTIKITLELPVWSVRVLEQAAECSIKQLLEAELGVNSIDCFIEKMDYNNW